MSNLFDDFDLDIQKSTETVNNLPSNISQDASFCNFCIYTVDGCSPPPPPPTIGCPSVGCPTAPQTLPYHCQIVVDGGY